jgi:thiol-disulfide isomerase/thioredoxin
VNFWKTSCVPCVKEIPQLNKLVKKYVNDSVVFLAISPEEESQINNFLKKHEFNFIQIVKGKNFIELTENNFMNGYPTSFILNKNGKLVFKQKWSSDKIDKILSEQIERIKNY